MIDFDELVTGWAKARNITMQGTKESQFEKLLEEVDELRLAIETGDAAEFDDAIGDCVVVLTILARLGGSDIETAIKGAWNVIKDRKGKMIDGKFVKEAG